MHACVNNVQAAFRVKVQTSPPPTVSQKKGNEILQAA